MIYGILIFFIPLLLLEGFFAASEIALVSANRRRLHHRAEEGYRGARLALKLLSRPEYLLATTLLGAYMSSAANTILVTAFLLDRLGSGGEVSAMIVLPPLILILGEIIPKSIGRQQATVLAERLAPPLWVASWVIYPITLVFAGLSRLVLLVGRGPQDRPAALHHPGGPAPGGDQERPGSGPRGQGAPLHPPHPAVQPAHRQGSDGAAHPGDGHPGHPDHRPGPGGVPQHPVLPAAGLPPPHRQPHRGAPRFRPVGRGGPGAPHRAFIRPVNYVPELKKIDRLLAEMQRQGSHLAVVVDEYGGAVGIVTIEDLLEEIVGEITDEFDQEVAPFKKLGEGHYLISARTEIKALNESLHLDLPPGDYETLAGFLISQLGDLPRGGEQVQYRNLKFTVRQAEARAVKEVELFVDVAPE